MAVLARKYRPQFFEDLVGQEAVSKTLSLALDSNKLSHAYLFSGIRGGGKTSTARIFAKALLCENGPTSKPCNECKQCTMAKEGRHIDIIELDAASNRGIDDIKDLIEQTKYKPSIGRYKIFIIDEVHMLTTQAFNALLKTLEEPPSFVKFILATTDPLKLPATILSRVQHFRFKKIPTKVVKEHLGFILNKEGIEFEDSAIEIVARSGQGSIRDSLTILDQAIVYANGKITTKVVTNMLGVLDPKILAKLLDAIMNKYRDKVLEFIENFSDYEAEMIIDELSLYLKEQLFGGSKSVSVLIIDRFFRILSEAKSLLSIGAEGEFVLTLTLFKMIEAVNVLDIDDAIEELEKELCATKAMSVKEESVKEKSLANNKQEVLDASIKESEKKDLSNSLESSELKFKKLIEKIYDRNYELGEVFEKNVSFVSLEENLLTWESSADENERVVLRNGWSIIKLFTQEIFGLDIKIKVNQKKNLNKILQNETNESNNEKIIQNNEDKLENKEDFKSSCIMPEGKDEASIDKDPQKLLEEPMIKEFIEKFNPKRVVIKQKT